ncbi:hypothetical protein DAEQUDRAFT_664906, partial [Daedalea quercina L-15889]
MSLAFLSAALATALLATAGVNAESHTVRFANLCGSGTPTLIGDGGILSTGEDYTSDGPFESGLAYVVYSSDFFRITCDYNGEECLIVEMTLGNPTVPGGGSSTDISAIAPHAFNVQTSFSYYGSCNNTGADCASEGCTDAFYSPDDNQVQVACEDDNVNLLIAFCA